MPAVIPDERNDGRVGDATIVKEVKHLPDQVVCVPQTSVVRTPHQRLVTVEAVVTESSAETVRIQVLRAHLRALVPVQVRYIRRPDFVLGLCNIVAAVHLVEERFRVHPRQVRPSSRL